ncbi:isochorismate synthase [Dietzia psychralcaliphila]|uniref:isochorismate synthase n=1 Tax=Dietzia psychralcaliphila TaxID=139021 RepID=A0AAD0JQ18_9ACTN|nr:isochorismate synthase [Dietzia psychralcaliphila]AWH95720.1 hypothetical protein A6048_09605 [Dietzia psychralcaliphila]PTM88509.1 isochorismate synthase [Dietzia psychralcaliphila]
MASGPHPDAARPVTAPDFLLSRHTGSLRTQGALRVFPDPADAALALRSGDCGLVVGAIGFEPDAPAALVEPDIVVRTDGPLEPPAYFRAIRTRARVAEELPTTEVHRRRVATAIAGIRAGGLAKVVLARAVRLVAEETIDPHAVCAALIDSSPSADGFLVDLSPAGGVHTGRVLVGSSPELLVRRRGDIVECHPLAGSAPRSADPAVDQASGRALQASGKDAAEHAFVVESLAAALAPLCRGLEIPEHPSLTSTREMWHLGTRIRGRIADTRTTALDLALAVHPTPAVCGTPTAEARRVIAGIEGERGFYSGAVGWADAGGDGDWMVTIRCAEIDADRAGALAWAGGGLVADSDPDDEVAETAAKLRTVLTALGAV